MLLLIRLVPAVPFFVANLVPALVGVPLVPFVVTTLVGIVPGALVYSSVGAGLGAVFAAGETPDSGSSSSRDFCCRSWGCARWRPCHSS